MKFLGYLIICFTIITQTSLAQDCPPFISTDNSGNVGITIYSENGECFTVKKMNAKINSSPANQVVFSTNMGFTPLKIELTDGTVIEKKIAIGETILTANYRIQLNKKGVYILKLLPFQSTTSGPTPQELMAQAEADRKAFVAKSEAESAAAKKAKEDKKAQEEADRLAEEKALEDKKIADEKAALAAEEAKNAPKETRSSSTSSSSSNSASTSGEGITIKISNGGSPAVDWEVAIECSCTTKGWGVTDNQGIVFIPSSNIRSKNINVYGVKGNDKFNLEGVIVLDNNNYVEIDPTQVMKMMNDKIQQFEQMDDMSDEEIMNSFGF